LSRQDINELGLAAATTEEINLPGIYDTQIMGVDDGRQLASSGTVLQLHSKGIRVWSSFAQGISQDRNIRIDRFEEISDLIHGVKGQLPIDRFLGASRFIIEKSPHAVLPLREVKESIVHASRHDHVRLTLEANKPFGSADSGESKKVVQGSAETADRNWSRVQPMLERFWIGP